MTFSIDKKKNIWFLQSYVGERTHENDGNFVTSEFYTTLAESTDCFTGTIETYILIYPSTFGERR